MVKSKRAILSGENKTYNGYNTYMCITASKFIHTVMNSYNKYQYPHYSFSNHKNGEDYKYLFCL